MFVQWLMLKKKINKQNNTRASGLNINFSDKQGILTVEFAPDSFNAYQVASNYSHQNQYRRLKISQFPDPSSDHRLARINELPSPKMSADVCSILGDTKDKQYPIYRNSSPPDDSSTLATMVTDFRMNSISVYLGNPKTSSPEWVWKIAQ